MAADDFVHAPPERAHVEMPPQPDAERYIVSKATGLKLIDEPQPLLREGDWNALRLSVQPMNLSAALRRLVFQAEEFDKRSLL
jgi:hypothetical protein